VGLMFVGMMVGVTYCADRFGNPGASVGPSECGTGPTKWDC
jgi:hypothetical protein